MIPSIRLNRIINGKGLIKRFGVEPLSEKEVQKYNDSLNKKLSKNQQQLEQLNGKEDIKSLKKIQKLELEKIIINKRINYLATAEVPKIGYIQAINYTNEDLVYLEPEKDKVLEKINKRILKTNQKREKIEEKLSYLINKKETTGKGRIERIVKTSDKIQKQNLKNMHNNTDIELLNLGKLPRKNVIQRFKTWFSNINYDKQKAIWGMLFVLPFALGVFLIFLPSTLKTFAWSFYEVKAIPAQGYVTTFIGLKNYIELFRDYVIPGNMIFSVEIFNFLKRIVVDVPIIIIFSILIAVLLNKKFKGHMLIKAIFFIPIVFNTTLVSEMMKSSFGQMIDEGSKLDKSFVDMIIGFFMNLNIGEGLINIVLETINRIFEIINLSGIQILIFIAAIQSIPAQLYEAAKIEGATKYETFWKITIPMITPLILTAVVFTVVDGFARAPIIQFLNKALADNRYGLASSISIIYLLINVAIIGLVFLILGKGVFYHDKRK